VEGLLTHLNDVGSHCVTEGEVTNDTNHLVDTESSENGVLDDLANTHEGVVDEFIVHGKDLKSKKKKKKKKKVQVSSTRLSSFHSHLPHNKTGHRDSQYEQKTKTKKKKKKKKRCLPTF
jgi:hypothetical protein